GGLKRMQEVFGEAACITGLSETMGGDTEFVQHIAQYNNKAIMFGLLDVNPLHDIEGIEGGMKDFSNRMSPSSDSSPELFWQDNVLRSSETSDGRTLRVIQADEGI